MVKIIQNNDMSEALTKKYAVIDFSAVWCGPCKMTAPILEKLSDEMSEVAFYNLDVDVNDELAMQFGIQSIPTMVVLKEGKPVAQTVGFRPEPALRSWIEQAVA
jgi:thioredoxin 1